MTPHYPQPSAHDVVTGYFTPNAVDIEHHLGNDFGTTIKIFAEDTIKQENEDYTAIECDSEKSAEESGQAIERSKIYLLLLDYFGLATEED